MREPDVLTPSVPPDIGARTQRQRILEAMAKSCSEKTFALTTIADIVGHASISRATFYKHFENKRGCFDAAVDGVLTELQEAVVEARQEDEPDPDVVRGATAAVLGRLAENSAQANLLLIEAPNVDPEIVRHYRDMAVRALETQLKTRKVARSATADPEIAFGRAKVLVTDYLAGGEIERIPSLLPELIYIALLPYVGQKEAVQYASLVR